MQYNNNNNLISHYFIIVRKQFHRFCALKILHAYQLEIYIDFCHLGFPEFTIFRYFLRKS